MDGAGANYGEWPWMIQIHDTYSVENPYTEHVTTNTFKINISNRRELRNLQLSAIVLSQLLN